MWYLVSINLIPSADKDLKALPIPRTLFDTLYYQSQRDEFLLSELLGVVVYYSKHICNRNPVLCINSGDRDEVGWVPCTELHRQLRVLVPFCVVITVSLSFFSHPKLETKTLRQ